MTQHYINQILSFIVVVLNAIKLRVGKLSVIFIVILSFFTLNVVMLNAVIRCVADVSSPVVFISNEKNSLITNGIAYSSIILCLEVGTNTREV